MSAVVVGGDGSSSWVGLSEQQVSRMSAFYGFFRVALVPAVGVVFVVLVSSVAALHETVRRGREPHRRHRATREPQSAGASVPTTGAVVGGPGTPLRAARSWAGSVPGTGAVAGGAPRAARSWTGSVPTTGAVVGAAPASALGSGLASCWSAGAVLREGKGRVQLVLVLFSFFAFTTQVLSYRHFAVDHRGHESVCEWSPSLAVTTFTVASSLFYLFLLLRAGAAARGEGSPHPWLRKLMLSLKLGALCSPLFVLAAFLFMEGEAVTAAQLPGSPVMCAFRIEPAVTALFLVSDLLLSSGFLVVFALPVWRAARAAREAQASVVDNGVLLRLLRKNLTASAGAILSTLIFMSLLTVGMFRLSEPGANVMLYETWSNPMVTIDLFVKVIAIVFVTNAWMPSGVRARWVSLSGSLHGGASCMGLAGRAVRPVPAGASKGERPVRDSVATVSCASPEPRAKTGVAKEQMCPPRASQEAGAALAPARPPPDRDSWTRDDSVDDSGLDETGPSDDVVVARPGASGAAGSKHNKPRLAVTTARARVDRDFSAML